MVWSAASFSFLFLSLGAFAYSFVSRVSTGNVAMVYATLTMLVIGIIAHIIVSALERKRPRPTSEYYSGKDELIFYSLMTLSWMILGAATFAFIDLATGKADWVTPIAFVIMYLAIGGLLFVHGIKHAVDYPHND